MCHELFGDRGNPMHWRNVPTDSLQAEIVALLVQFTRRLRGRRITRVWFLTRIGGGSAAVEKHSVNRVAAQSIKSQFSAFRIFGTFSLHRSAAAVEGQTILCGANGSEYGERDEKGK